MCGIWLLCGLEPDESHRCNEAFGKICHRGPDAWRMEMDSRMKNVLLGFHRLSIVDILHGMQPMRLHQYPHLTLLCNGEIYNSFRVRDDRGFRFETNCDVEVIIHAYAKLGIEAAVKELDGVFSFVIVDAERREVHVARDPFGVRPSFVLRTDDGVLGVCSEAKGLMPIVRDDREWKVSPFPPGTFESYAVDPSGKVTLARAHRYYRIGETKPEFKPYVPWEEVQTEDVDHNIRRLLVGAVEKRRMSDRRIGCLLSGGLDSSLVAALLVDATKALDRKDKVQTFSVGMESSPDLVAARQVARHIGSEHHEVVFTEQDVERVLDDVIRAAETPDITTIRASIGMYLLSEYIQKNTNSTVILSGEGADEVAQGYIYFRDAPGAREGHEESLRLLRDIYLFDGLRADRTTAAHSLELRLPFLDQQFTWYYLSLAPEMRRPRQGVEKHLLRKAFDGTDLLPKNILWRHKEAFSDGVASTARSLFTVLRDVVDRRVTDAEFRERAPKFSSCTPKTKEAYYYRKQFEKTFPNQCERFMGYYWMPKWTNAADPSARFISHYAADGDKAEDARNREEPSATLE